MITKCMVCLLNPNKECTHCGRKYMCTPEHTCEVGRRHIYATCLECMCDQCEGRVPTRGEDNVDAGTNQGVAELQS